MLELRDITKTYTTAGETIHALKGVSLRFRKSEFVSILGPSGCGKTTTLNIIGGLDHYTSGDLIINGRSTKDYKDRDWDTYRNHSIGFVFQSYNLIPHQTVLQNVELALTLSGVSKKERRARAKEALERVGLGNQLKKKPMEMSGGQMQRVAIARAIVNKPDIILADEPTGALDTQTSIQVLDILKEISRECLVIMVTHNAELAEKYSTRIVKMLDGVVLGDTLPPSDEELKADDEDAGKISAYKKVKSEKKPSISPATSFSLSLKNLFTKRGRTILTSFAGSIGIIGIALIYAVSQGTTNYIAQVQEETLSSYPITLEAQTVDVSSLLETFMGKAESIEEHENDAVYQKAMMYELMNAVNSLDEHNNDLKAFKVYLEEQRENEDSVLHDAVNAVQYTYDVNMLIYTENVDGEIIRSDTQELMTNFIMEYANLDVSSLMSLSSNSIMSSSMETMQTAANLWQELIPGDNGDPVSPVIQKQYELLYGTWPHDYDEVILFTDSENELDDLTLYALGLKPREEIEEIMDASFNRSTIEYESHSWSYEEICSLDFRTILSADCYVYDPQTDTYTDMRDSSTGLKYLYDGAMKLKVVGIARPAEGATGSSSARGSIGYTYQLIDHIIEYSSRSDAVEAQKASPDRDIFTGLPFADPDGNIDASQKASDFKAYIEALNDEAKAETYIKMMSIPSDDEVEAFVSGTLASMSREEMETMMMEAMSGQLNMDEETITSYIANMSDEDINEIFEEMLAEQYRSEYAVNVSARMAELPAEQLLYMLDGSLSTCTEEQLAVYYDSILEFSDSTYEDNLVELGCIDIASPSSINLYSSTFADKDLIEEEITRYNDSVEDIEEIHYTDYVGIIMSSVTTIINAVTYVLIGFVAVSLVVSSIMIGVITLISVQERTKEIGILRALGASKHNVKGLFNAETVIIGFASGVIGVSVTALLCIPINLILRHVTGIMSLKAVLPLPVAVILVVISVLLTLIAGIIPSGSAAKKDPVIALRSE